MLRLRQQIEQARTRPWLRFAVVLALAVLLVFTVAHLAHDVAHDDDAGGFAAAVCMAIVFTVGLLAFRRQPPGYRVSPWALAYVRPPAARAPAHVRSYGFTPLRR